MQLHEARRANLSNKKKLRVGRGPASGIGKTSGRGLKGATARSGYAMKVTYEGGQMPLFRRLPKRGFTNGPFRVTFSVVNVGQLSGLKAGTAVGPDELRDAGLLMGNPNNPVKVLGDGELKVALTVKADAFSKSAIEKIQKAGGKAEWIGGAPKKKAPNFNRIEKDKKRAERAKGGDAKAGAKPEAKGEGKPEAKAEGQGAPKAEGKPAKPAAPKPPKAPPAAEGQ